MSSVGNNFFGQRSSFCGRQAVANVQIWTVNELVCVLQYLNDVFIWLFRYCPKVYAGVKNVTQSGTVDLICFLSWLHTQYTYLWIPRYKCCKSQISSKCVTKKVVAFVNSSCSQRAQQIPKPSSGLVPRRQIKKIWLVSEWFWSNWSSELNFGEPTSAKFIDKNQCMSIRMLTDILHVPHL